MSTSSRPQRSSLASLSQAASTSATLPPLPAALATVPPAHAHARAHAPPAHPPAPAHPHAHPHPHARPTSSGYRPPELAAYPYGAYPPSVPPDELPHPHPTDYEYEYEYEYDPYFYPSHSIKRPRYAPPQARASVPYLPAAPPPPPHDAAAAAAAAAAFAYAHPHPLAPSASVSSAPPAVAAAAAPVPATTVGGVPIPPPASKRQKTQRACDCCRRKRIRCDIIEPLKMCVHCRTYGLQCSFCLPISETRFKKKKESDGDVSGTYAAVAGPPGAEGLVLPPEKPSPSSTDNEDGLPTPSGPPERRSASASAATAADAMILGPTSIAYLVHSTPFVPTGAIEEHDRQAHQTFEVGANGDGVIKFHKLPKGRGVVPSAETESDGDEVAAYTSPTQKTEVDLARRQLAGDVAEKLTNTYFAQLGTLFPVVTKSEFVYTTPAPPALLYAICSVTAQSRDVPSEVRAVLRGEVATLFRDGAMLTRSHTTTIRALLIMSLHHDVHGSFLHAPSRHWNRTGLGIRMAQDLGFHRESFARSSGSAPDAYHVEQRRRLWGACVAADRWASLYAGRPLSIDLTDCDVRLPSPVEVVRSKPGSETPLPRSTAVSGDGHVFAFNTEMVKLSILFGRVLKTIYSPTGLMNATDAQIEGLLADINAWHEGLPPELHYTDADANPGAGILQVSYACLLVLFFRVFMRISYVCPTHLRFSLTIERMTAMLDACKRACDWAAAHPFYCDTLSCVSYCLVSCATLLYHAYVRRKDAVALEKLRAIEKVYASADPLSAPPKAKNDAEVSPKTTTAPSPKEEEEEGKEKEKEKETEKEKEKEKEKEEKDEVHDRVESISSTDASWRSKCGAVLKILLDAALGAYPDGSSEGPRPSALWGGVLNPTAGVSNRKTVEMVASLKFRPDPNLPGGGVFIADADTLIAKDLPGGTVIKNRSDTTNESEKKRKHSDLDEGTETGQKEVPLRTPSQDTPPKVEGKYEWPITSTSLLHALAHGTEAPTEPPMASPLGSSPAAGAKVVTTLPVQGLESGMQPSISSLAHPQPPYAAIGTGATPNFNPRLNDLIWSTPTTFVFEAPAGSPGPATWTVPAPSNGATSNGATSNCAATANGTGTGTGNGTNPSPPSPGRPQDTSANPTGAPTGVGGGIFMPEVDPLLLEGLPQSLDFDAWSSWNARLPHTSRVG